MKKFTVVIASFLSLWFIGSKLGDKDKEEMDRAYNKVISDFDETGYQNYGHGVDTLTQIENKPIDPFPEGWPNVKPKPVEIRYIYPNSYNDNLSDEEIRILREKNSYRTDGRYIYTPRRIVPTREQEIENYIEKHGRDIYEQLEDEYGN